MEVVPPHVLAIGSLVPVQKSSPERRNQKEIVAGEERPKFLTIKQTEDAQGKFSLEYYTCHLSLADIHSITNTLEEFSEFIANAESDIQPFFALFNPHRSVNLLCFFFILCVSDFAQRVHESRKHPRTHKLIFMRYKSCTHHKLFAANVVFLFWITLRFSTFFMWKSLLLWLSYSFLIRA